MDITAVRENPNKPYTLTLNGAPPGSVVEVRMTNSMNGVQEIHTGEVKDGVLTIPAPLNFGQHISFEARVLAADRADKIIQFHYVPESTGDSLKLVATNEGTVPEPNPVTQPQNITPDNDHDGGTY